MWSKEETDRLSHSDNTGWVPLKSHSFIQIYSELGHRAHSTLYISRRACGDNNALEE